MAALQLDMVTEKKQELSGNFSYEAQVFPSILDENRTVTAEIYI